MAPLPPCWPVPQTFSSSQFLHAAEDEDEAGGVVCRLARRIHYRKTAVGYIVTWGRSRQTR